MYHTMFFTNDMVLYYVLHSWIERSVLTWKTLENIFTQHWR